MKKITMIFAAVAALVAVSCDKEMPGADSSIPDGMKMVTITASICEDAEVLGRTSYTPEEGKGIFSWTKGDKIAIKGSDNVFYHFTAKSSGATSEFVGYLPESITPQKHALYPAESAGSNSSGQYFYTVPEYKDLSKSFSADIPMSSYVSAGTYQFKHMTGAALLTFTNIPDGVSVVEVSIKANSVRLSGTQEIWSGTPFSFTAAEAANESEKTFTRKLSVANNQVQVYLPYKGGFWDSCTINITGYDQSGKSIALLKDKTMKGTSANDFTPGLIIPYTALALPNYVPPVDWTTVNWNAENVASVTNSSTSDDAILEEMKVVADDYYMYVWIKSALQTPYGGNFIDILLSDGDAEAEGAAKAWDQWPGTLGVDIYKKEHKGEINADGNIISMIFNHNGTYENVEFKNEIVDGKINWYLVFPVEYMQKYKSANGSVYVGFRLWKDWDNFAAIPARGWGQSMLEVTLP